MPQIIAKHTLHVSGPKGTTREIEPGAKATITDAEWAIIKAAGAGVLFEDAQAEAELTPAQKKAAEKAEQEAEAARLKAEDDAAKEAQAIADKAAADLAAEGGKAPDADSLV